MKASFHHQGVTLHVEDACRIYTGTHQLLGKFIAAEADHKHLHFNELWFLKDNPNTEEAVTYLKDLMNRTKQHYECNSTGSETAQK